MVSTPPPPPDERVSVMENELSNSRERVAALSVPPPEVPGADRQELLRMLDRRQHEIARLAEEWKNMSTQLELTSAKKTEFQTRYLSEIQSKGGTHFFA